MELREFVKESLLQIIQGVVDAQRQTGSTRIGGVDERQLVAFDVAVTAVESSEKGGKAGLSVAGFIDGGGSLKSTTSSTTVNRIQFSVPVWMDLDR